MRNFFLGLFICFMSFSAYASPSVPKILQDSHQLLLVIAPDQNGIHGSLQRFQRTRSHWQAVGTKIPVVLGKNGLAWGNELKDEAGTDPVKQEGDGRSPMGVYLLGPLFGFADHFTKKTEYVPLTETSFCVDDVTSAYYNQLLDSAMVPKPDWHSGEEMHKVPGYEIGSMVQYNQNPKAVPGAGSCIFMHIWKNPPVGSAGCVAMDKNNLTLVLNWMDMPKKPVIVILSDNAYQKLKNQWKLPNN